MAGCYFKVGVKDGYPVWRSQDNLEEDEYKVPTVAFLWFDTGSELWFISFMPVIDGDNHEWESACLHVSFDKDMNTCWCPWNAAEASKLRITTLADYEHWKRRMAEKKLLAWQSWWHAGGQNDLLDYPPAFPVPPPKAKADAEPARPKTPETPPQAFAGVPPGPPPPKLIGGPKPPETPPPSHVAKVASNTGDGSVGSTPASGSRGDEVKLNYSWKARMVALIGAMDLNLPARVQHLRTKPPGYSDYTLMSF